MIPYASRTYEIPSGDDFSLWIDDPGTPMLHQLWHNNNNGGGWVNLSESETATGIDNGISYTANGWTHNYQFQISSSIGEQHAGTYIILQQPLPPSSNSNTTSIAIEANQY